MKTIRLILAILLSIVFASCGGGGGGGATATQTLSGTAAQGAPIANASITIKDKNGSKIIGTTGSDGKYTMNITGKTPPFLLQVPAKNGGYLYSVATASGTANIHPFTNLIIRNWYKVQGSDVETDFNGTGALAKVPTVTEINTIEAVVRSILSTSLSKEGLNAPAFDLITSPFDANNTGFDKVLDNTNVAVGTTGVTVTATDPATGITGTMVSTNLSTDLTAADTTKPSGPTGLSALPSGTASIVLIWDASTDNVGVAGYNIYRGTTKVGTSPYPVYSDTGLTSSTNYCYQVEAFDGAGNVSANKSSQVCATTPAAADTVAPAPPTSLTATAASTSQIDLSWGASTDNVGVAAYAIYRGVTKIATVTATSYSDTGLSSGTLYSYTVKALDGALNYSVASNTASATTQAGIPAAPTGISATAGDGQVTISWTAVSGATSYNVYWLTSTGVTKAGGTKINGVTSPYTHTGRTNGTKYYYVVTAVNSSGESVESAQVSATPTTAGAGVSQFDGIYTGSYSGTVTTAGILTITVTNGMLTGTAAEVGSATLTGTVSASGAVTVTTITISGCPGITATFTGQITGAVMTGTYSNGAGGSCVGETGTWTATRNYAGTYSGILTTTSAGSGTFSATVDSAGAMNGSIYFNGATAAFSSGQVTSGGIVSFMLSGKTDTYSGTINAATGAFAAACTSGCVDNPVFTGVKRATVGTAFPIANTSGIERSGGAAFDGTNFLVSVMNGINPRSINAQLVSKTGALVGSSIPVATAGCGGRVAFDGTNYLIAWKEDTFPGTFIKGQFLSPSGALIGAPVTIATGQNVAYNCLIGVLFDGSNYFVAWNNESTPGSGDTSDEYGQFVTPGGTKLGSVIPISTAAHGQRDPAIAFDGANILVAWTDGRNQSACFTLTTSGTYDGELYNAGTHCFESDVYGQFIAKSGAAAAGTLAGSNFLIDAGTLPRDNPIDIAFDGTNYLVTFTEEAALPSACPLSGCTWEAYGILVSQAGAAIGSKFVIGNPAINQKFIPLPAYLGTKYLVTWTDGMGTASASVKGQYVTTSGAVSGSEFTLFSPASSGTVPYIGFVLSGGGANLSITNWGIPSTIDPSNFDLYTSQDVMGSIITFP